MKKLVLTLLVFGIFFGLSGCGATANDDGKTSSSSVKESTVNSSDEEDKEMEAMEVELKEQGVEMRISKRLGGLILSREKSIDYDYFEMSFYFNSKTEDFVYIMLELKGNIDGKKKDLLYYDESGGRLVEEDSRNTDITKIAEVLESLNYSDQEMLEFAQWYYENNK
ncbi:hypothetical protein IW492_01855 [Enterococcus sp. BWB1-3]|uniref:hypothetical protein n=1 Tax=Enterococcus sp. BWB1-3 TaxID=2787713 RepID=UPI001920ED35|nr:hypothetical protein [Enterococcus sp. BWB1-3]MBL1227973.1 hypothetical protein [Enterococcus sp. BWB1-3]